MDNTELFPGLEVKTVVIPTGDKPSVVADAPHDYAKDTSPDKVSLLLFRPWCTISGSERSLPRLNVFATTRSHSYLYVKYGGHGFMQS